MARASSKSPGSKGDQRRDPPSADGDVVPSPMPLRPEDRIPADSVEVDANAAEPMPTPEANGAEPPMPEEAELIAAEAQTKGEVEAAAPAAAPAPSPAASAPAPEPRQGGFVPMVLGGIVAAGVGYGAAYLGWLPTAAQPQDQSVAIAQALAPLQEQIAALAEAPRPEPQAIDLSPVIAQIEGLSTRIEAATVGIEDLAARVGALENRPLTALPAPDPEAEAEALALAAEAQAQYQADREAAEARAAELEAAAAAAAAQAQAAEAEAQAAIATAEAEAAAAIARAAAVAALGQLQAAIATGAPYGEALASIAAVAEVPDALSAGAQTGVPTLEALQEALPPLARAALPVALQETAGEGMGERLTAFVMGQIGGRSVEPRDGDDPDAVLSRVEAAIRAGDLPGSLSELAALPEGARAVLAPWAADVETRAAAEAGLASLTAALAGGGN